MFHGYSPAHIANIVLHVLSGSTALLVGMIAILSPKGGRVHLRSGRLFLYAYGAVVITALFGIFLFEFRSFLLVVTILSLYDVFAGYRALQLRGARPTPIDISFSAIGFITPWLFIVTMHYLHQPWAPALTWSILGGLLMISAYDLLRTVLPLGWLRKVWVQEHLFKMMSAYIAITSAFAGTVFPRALPWSALLPSVIGTAVSVGFISVGPRAWQKSRRPVVAEALVVSRPAEETP